MRHEGRGGPQQRREFADQGVAQNLAMSGQRSDAQALSLAPDAAQLRDVGDVDQELRRLQPQRERRHKALAAGDEARVLASLRMRGQRLLDRARPQIAESPRLHGCFRSLLWIDGASAGIVQFVTIWSQNASITRPPITDHLVTNPGWAMKTVIPGMQMAKATKKAAKRSTKRAKTARAKSSRAKSTLAKSARAKSSRPRRNMRAVERERLIVDEAIRFFAERGFDGEMRELAIRIGIAHSAIYRHFPSKEA